MSSGPWFASRFDGHLLFSCAKDNWVPKTRILAALSDVKNEMLQESLGFFNRMLILIGKR